MAIRLPKEIIESGLRLDTAIPKPIVDTKKNKDGSIGFCARYDFSVIDRFAKEAAHEINEKLEKALMEELMAMNGYVPERTCRIIARYEARTREGIGRESVELSCGHMVERHSKFCSQCGSKVVDEA